MGVATNFRSSLHYFLSFAFVSAVVPLPNRPVTEKASPASGCVTVKIRSKYSAVFRQLVIGRCRITDQLCALFCQSAATVELEATDRQISLLLNTDAPTWRSIRRAVPSLCNSGGECFGVCRYTEKRKHTVSVRFCHHSACTVHLG